MAFDDGALRVLAPGRRVLRPRRAGEVYGLRLKAGGAVPAVVLEVDIASGWMAGGTAIWLFGPPQNGRQVELDRLAGGEPISPPLLVDRSLWSHGVAFLWGSLPPSHALLQHRFLYQLPTGRRPVYDSSGRAASDVTRSDVIGVYGHTLLLGVDEAVAVGLDELLGSPPEG